MKSFRTCGSFAALLLLGFLVIVGCQSRKPMAHGDWRTLLDSSHTNGWKMVGPGELKWENGELVTYGGMGLLVYEREKLGNCQIRVVFKMTGAEDNSGVFIRMPKFPDDVWEAVNRGYEVQINDTGDDWHRTGCLYSFNKAINNVKTPVDEWATMLITLHGDRTMVEVNGKLVTRFKEGQPVPERHIWYEAVRGPRPNEGLIGLQNHGKDAHVHFKEVSVAPLL